MRRLLGAEDTSDAGWESGEAVSGGGDLAEELGERADRRSGKESVDSEREGGAPSMVSRRGDVLRKKPVRAGGDVMDHREPSAHTHTGYDDHEPIASTGRKTTRTVYCCSSRARLPALLFFLFFDLLLFWSSCSTTGCLATARGSGGALASSSNAHASP